MKIEIAGACLYVTANSSNLDVRVKKLVADLTSAIMKVAPAANPTDSDWKQFETAVKVAEDFDSKQGDEPVCYSFEEACEQFAG